MLWLKQGDLDILGEVFVIYSVAFPSPPKLRGRGQNLGIWGTSSLRKAIFWLVWLSIHTRNISRAIRPVL
jgi:hypothetical protein